MSGGGKRSMSNVYWKPDPEINLYWLVSMSQQNKPMLSLQSVRSLACKTLD